MSGKNALVIIDVQNDFLPTGALPVPGGDQVIPLINALVKLPFSLVVATRDFHPVKHVSFASRWGKNVGQIISVQEKPQILWPDHCVQGTFGADFPQALDVTRCKKTVFNKGADLEKDSYSAFEDSQDPAGIVAFLQKQAITDLYFTGLATDYCVLESVLDALKAGFRCFVVLEGCRAVNLHPQDEERAQELMKKNGAVMIRMNEVVKQIGEG